MPNAIEALLQAIDHQRAGRLPEAEALARTALSIEPEQPSALYLLGTLALATGRPAEAAALLARADQLRPHHREQTLALARALIAIGHAAEALDVCAGMTGDASFTEAHFLAGCAANALGRHAEAAHAFRRVLAVTPHHAPALLNLGNACVDGDNLDDAETYTRAAIANAPGLAEAHASLGHLLTIQGRPLEAIASCRKAANLQPDLAQAHWNRGVAHLLAGQFAEGWDAYEWRKRRYPACYPPLPGPQWEGEALDGRTILVRAEQGFGDALQFARYLPLLTRRGAHVVLQTASPLVALMQRIPDVLVVERGVVERGVVERGVVERGASPSHDVWVDQMSLPRLFRTVADTIPAASGYLTPDPVLAGTCDTALPFGLRIGVAWAGNPAHHNDRGRSMPVSALAPIVGAGAGMLVSLQVGPHAPDISKVFGITDLSHRLTDFAATAALVAGLDLVITVDTAVAHLAGALGIPTWLMLAHAPDWRWMLNREDSPWYSSMRLFRQERPGDWTGVVERVASGLAGIVRPSENFLFAPNRPAVACTSSMGTY